MFLKPFVINSHGRIVFPGNFFPELDFRVFKSLKQFAAVIRRDFGEKAPTDVEIAARVKAGEYKTRYELCRDLVLNRFWVNRYTLTMYEKRPTRWGDLPRQRDDVFLPVYKPRDSSAIATAIEAGYQDLPPSWDEELEDRSFGYSAQCLSQQPERRGRTSAYSPDGGRGAGRSGKPDAASAGVRSRLLALHVRRCRRLPASCA